MVECNLAKVDVAGSNPVSRSNVVPTHSFSTQCTPRLCYPSLSVVPGTAERGCGSLHGLTCDMEQ